MHRSISGYPSKYLIACWWRHHRCYWKEASPDDFPKSLNSGFLAYDIVKWYGTDLGSTCRKWMSKGLCLYIHSQCRGFTQTLTNTGWRLSRSRNGSDKLDKLLGLTEHLHPSARDFQWANELVNFNRHSNSGKCYLKMSSKRLTKEGSVLNRVGQKNLSWYGRE